MVTTLRGTCVESNMRGLSKKELISSFKLTGIDKTDKEDASGRTIIVVVVVGEWEEMRKERILIEGSAKIWISLNFFIQDLDLCCLKWQPLAMCGY